MDTEVQTIDTGAPRKEAWVPGNPNDRSVEGFRIRHGGSRGPMSRTAYYKLKKQGRGPCESHIGRRTIISAQAEAAWDEAQANPTGEHAQRVARDAELRLKLSRAAAKLAVKSPRHPSNAKRKARGG